MYSEAQLKIDDPNDKSAVAIGLRVLNTLAKIMKTKRFENGSLMLASTEVFLSLILSRLFATFVYLYIDTFPSSN
jgi:hypothetical protein